MRAALEQIPRSADDLDIEYEMLEALEQLGPLRRDLGSGRLPIIETGHRVVGSDACHFSAPASLPDDPAQPSGRFLLTSSRAVFIAGRMIAVPWHAARQAMRVERDVLLVRLGADDGIRVRCNTYADAVRAVEISRHLIEIRRGKQPKALSEDL